MDGVLFHLINFIFFTVGMGLKRVAGLLSEAEKSTCLKQVEIGNGEFFLIFNFLLTFWPQLW